MLFARYLIVLTIFFPLQQLFAQEISKKLQKAYSEFEKDEQLKHAMSSLYVIDAKTGEVVFDRNSQIGLAPASTQKIITSVTAFELLGKDYRFRTKLGYTGSIESGHVTGNLIIIGSGDPTLGSWRFNATNDSMILNKWVSDIKKAGITSYQSLVSASTSKDDSPKNTPDGWIWQDIGNYYGAASYLLNWRENQYDLYLKSDEKLGGSVIIVGTNPSYHFKQAFFSEATAAEKGTGDNAYIYLKDKNYIVAGTIPRGEEKFKISGALSNPFLGLTTELQQLLKDRKILAITKGLQFEGKEGEYEVVSTHTSPSLDSIIYWFNKKSINLYGEALLKTIAGYPTGVGSTDSGVAVVRRIWKEKGIDEDELNMYDGSGLSPLNRVTTHAQVEILKYARTKDWFQYFYNSLPEYNGMTMKSGTISDVKGFCGYHKSKDGREYIFSFLVNNYSGKTSGVVNKMYKVLNELK